MTASGEGKTVGFEVMGRSRSRSKSPSRRRHKSKHSRKRSKSREKHSNNKYSDKPKERSTKSRCVLRSRLTDRRVSRIAPRRSKDLYLAAILLHLVRLRCARNARIKLITLWIRAVPRILLPCDKFAILRIHVSTTFGLTNVTSTF